MTATTIILLTLLAVEVATPIVIACCPAVYNIYDKVMNKFVGWMTRKQDTWFAKQEA